MTVPVEPLGADCTIEYICSLFMGLTLERYQKIPPAKYKFKDENKIPPPKILEMLEPPFPCPCPCP